MAGLLHILGITLPIFLLIALGFWATKKSFLPGDANKALAAFAIYFALPALLFRSVSSKPMTELFQADYFLAYGAGSLASFCLVYAFGRWLFMEDGKRCAMWALGSSFSNTLMVSLPILILLYGAEKTVVPVALMLMVETFVILPLSLFLAESSGQEHKPWSERVLDSFKPLVKNPILIAIVAGALASLLNMPLPVVFTRVVDMLAVTVSGVALVALGGMLVGVPLGTMRKPLLTVMPAKLILHPLLVTAGFLLVGGIDPVMMSIGIVSASAPMFGIFPIIATRFGLGSEAAAIVVPTTIAAFFSINASLWLTGLYL
ncbi:MAG: AEC family transporter [Gammaproteobacteria bacterium]|nr:AEC family transporter [Gammaproteobacteria bacterium]